MKLSQVLTISFVTPANASDALDEVRLHIEDTQQNIKNDSEYAKTHPRAIGLERVKSRLQDHRSLLRNLRRRETRCLTLIAA
jgi:ppGpp synthetase/RelA/SpoT-type nucleotidyltranferase